MCAMLNCCGDSKVEIACLSFQPHNAMFAAASIAVLAAYKKK